MKRLILIALLLPFTANAQSPRIVAEKLQASVAELTRGGEATCTATKIGPATYLTARHCVSGLATNLRVETDSRLMWVKSITVSVQTKPDGRKEDWAVLHSSEENPDLSPLELACEEEIYLGMPVAMLGYSYPTSPSFVTGAVATTTRTRVDEMDSDFAIDIQAGPGASGAAIVSMDSGKVIGILIEGVMRSRGLGAFLVGVQSIGDTDMCD